MDFEQNIEQKYVDLKKITGKKYRKKKKA